jgi:hypothetical protein
MPVVNKKQKHQDMKMEVTEFVNTDDKLETVRIFPEVTICSSRYGSRMIIASRILPDNKLLPDMSSPAFLLDIFMFVI